MRPHPTCGTWTRRRCWTRSWSGVGPLTGHNALRAYLLDHATTQRDVDFTVERHWVSGSTVLAAWHVAWTARADGRLVRWAGFLTADVESDGRISRFREWALPAPTNG